MRQTILVAERQSQHLLRLEVGDPGIIVAENPPEHLFGMFAELGRECSGRGRNTSKAHGLWHVADRTEVVTDPAEDHPPLLGVAALDQVSEGPHRGTRDASDSQRLEHLLLCLVARPTGDDCAQLVFMSVSCWIREESGIVAELRPPDGVQQGDERGVCKTNGTISPSLVGKLSTG